MKRIHIHVNTQDATFDASVAFYTTLFGQAPTKTRAHYAKWMLDDPRVNFVVEVIEIEGDSPGIHHVGLQVDDTEELNVIAKALKAAEAPLLEIGETVCCFSKSEKNWTMDPSGLRWETFRSFGDVDDYGEKTLSELAHYNA
ncbi:VOC family protein [Fretibacter rubidus]|uniref:VOC family protein n=1 Tax=Fretibacter rubidus TaxID=570162 RepID=UPI00352A4819